jgi:cytochrome c oxidase assembly protein subunit 15
LIYRGSRGDFLVQMDIDNQQANPFWLHRFILFTTACTFLLIIAGALVTGNEAGLAVPDWPLSYGSLMPPMVGNIRYEHGHRMIAAFVGFLTTVLAVWLWRREPRRTVRRLGLIALGMVIGQGILGGITVLLFLPTVISVSHACLAQAFFCTMVSLALVTAPKQQGLEFRRLTENPGAPLQRLCVLTTAAIYVQLIIGAALRHSKSGILLHLGGAFVVAVLVVLTVARTLRHYGGCRQLVRSASILGLLLTGQLFLGIGSYVVRLTARNDVQPALSVVTVTTAHVALGALVLATSLILAIQSHRTLSPSLETTPLPSAAQRVTS